MEDSAQPSKRALAGLKSHKLNSLNGLLTHGVPRNGHDGAAPPPVAKRLDVIKAYAADCVLPPEGADVVEAGTAVSPRPDASVSQIAQRFAPRPGSFPPPEEDRLSAGPLAPPLLALASGARTLAAALIAVALLPNLVLAGLIWYGGIETRWPSVTETPPATDIGMPAVHSVVTVPIPVPSIASGLAESGDVTGALPADLPHSDAAASSPEASLATDEDQELAAANIDDAQAVAAAAPAEPMPLPTRRPAPPSAEEANASWIKATAYVNLRSAPSRGASVVGVVAKGTKLRVVARKRGWVQATDPASEKTGWVYSGNVAASR